MLRLLRDVSGLFLIVTVGMLWSESANAGCKNIGGTMYCASWITGSEVQVSNITGLGNIKDNCSTPGQGCPKITAVVFGTGGSRFDTIEQATNSSCNPANIPAGGDACAIGGILQCVNNGDNAKKAQGNPFLLDSVLSNTGLLELGDCGRNGRCTERVTVDIDVSNPNLCQNSNWNALSFTASDFFAYSLLEWFDNKGVPQTAAVLDYCKVDLTPTSKPGQMYQCMQLPLNQPLPLILP